MSEQILHNKSIKTQNVPSNQRRNKKIPPPRVFGSFSSSFPDSRHAQLSIYTVFDEESDIQIKNKEIRRPEAKNEAKQT